MRRGRRSGADEAKIDMTPMLDIVFIMLIFFIVTAVFTRESGIDLRQPPASDQPPPPNAPPVIVVQVDSTNRVFVNQTLTDVERVGAQIERFRSDNPNSPVLIEPAEDAEHGVVVDIWDQAREVGAVGISIQVRPAASS
jgi:biopolymer transport protein ExbD